MSKPQDPVGGDATADDGFEAEFQLQELIIDGNSNAFSDSWTNFRSSMRSNASGKHRECLGLLASMSKRTLALSSSSGLVDTVDEVKGKEDNDNTDGGKIGASRPSAHGNGPLDVPFSNLTPGEKRDLRAWNTRLSREVSFSRYYFPDPWELRELKALQTFLELEDPEHDLSSSLNSAGQETTKRAVTSIFFPGDHDPKHVLLKRGPTLSNGTDERELLLFTHAFVLSRIGLDALMEIMFTLNSEDPTQLTNRFDEIDSDQSGCLDRCELKEFFTSLGMPIGEIALSDIMERFDTDQDGTIDRSEFEAALSFRHPKKEEKGWGTWAKGATVLGTLGQKISRSFTKRAASRRLDCAYEFSEIERLESIDVCFSNKTEMYAQSSWAELVLAIFLKGKSDPVVLVCSKPEHRLAWVDAFKTCFVNSTQMRANSGFEPAKEVCKTFGWQHRIIRASIFSLVVCNDVAVLEIQLSKLGSSPDICIDDQDEYYGYSALHYAVVLCNMGCAKLLIKHGANMNLLDFDEKSPLDHATQTESKDMNQLLERHGAKTNISEVLFKSAIEEQEQLKRKKLTAGGKKTIDKAKMATGVLGLGLAALRERGEKIESLDNTTTELHNGASDYATMAKQMKEKKKKKASIFGV